MHYLHQSPRALRDLYREGVEFVMRYFVIALASLGALAGSAVISLAGSSSASNYVVLSDGTVKLRNSPVNDVFQVKRLRNERRKNYWRLRKPIDRRRLKRSAAPANRTRAVSRERHRAPVPTHARSRSTMNRTQQARPTQQIRRSQQQPPDHAIAARSFSGVSKFETQWVNYTGKHAPGTIIIDTRERLLYLVHKDGVALRYGVGVGRPGFTWAGTHRITRKAEWPSWRPPASMLARRPDLPRFMAGGPKNPLGARALYLGSTLYRIHGSNAPHTIGQAVSSGCIRMRNVDVIDLYRRVNVGTKVVVI